MRTTRCVQGLSPMASGNPLVNASLRKDRRQLKHGMYLPTRTLVCEHRAESLLGADSSAISEWPAFGQPRANPTGVSGTGNWTLTQGTGGNQPTCRTNILAGYSIARFDGGDFLNYPNTGSGMANFTYFAVFKVNDTANRTIFASVGSGEAQIQVTGNRVFLVKVASSILGNSNAVLDTTNFFTICVAYDRTLATGNLDFYINGVLDTTVNVTTDITVGNIFMGGRNAGTTEPFLGDIAHDAFYYSKLSAQEIAQANYALRSLYRNY